MKRQHKDEEEVILSPDDPAFWLQEYEKLYEVLFPQIRDALIKAAQFSFDSMMAESGDADVGVSWSVINQWAIDWANTYTQQVVAQITQTSMAAFLENFQPWMISGDPLSDLVEKLIPYYGEVRADMIAVTEVTRAYAQGNLAFWKATNLVTGFDVQTAMDDLVCPICNGKRSQNHHALEDEAPPYHVRCVLPGNEVLIPDLVAAAKSFYDGRCVEIILFDGRRISVTENHPILTPRGWVPAKLLRELDDVFVARDGQRIASSINPDYQNRPTAIEEIFGSAKESGKMSSVRVKASAEDFYGDGRSVHGYIDIVKVDSLLRNHVQPSYFQPFSQLNFNGSRPYQGSLVGESVSDLLSLRHNSTPGNLMSRGDLFSPLPVGHVFPLHQFSLGLRTRMNASLQKSLPESSAIDSALAREFVLRFSGQVALEKVFKVRNFDYSGHVFDLQSGLYGLYNCNGVIVKNCRCWLRPVMEEF